MITIRTVIVLVVVIVIGYYWFTYSEIVYTSRCVRVVLAKGAMLTF